MVSWCSDSDLVVFCGGPLLVCPVRILGPILIWYRSVNGLMSV